jgi:putative phage-type endonuclease
MEDKGTYYLVNVKQRSSDWFYMRKKRITGSTLPKVVGHAPYCQQSNEEIAEILTGKKKEVFTEEAKKRMSKGNLYEDYVRGYLEKKLNLKFYEEGFCIWKKDPIFGCSNDGSLDEEVFLEIKCPAKMYKPIQDYIDDKEKDKNSIDHIYKSHYDQITMNGVVTNRKYAIFCVYAHEEKKIFFQKIKIDYDYWYDFLYPTAKNFYNTYMVSLLENK